MNIVFRTMAHHVWLFPNIQQKLKKIDFFTNHVFVMQKNGLIGKVNFKIYDVITWETKNYSTQYTHCPISQKVNAIRQWNFNQLIQNNMRNIFFETSYTKSVGETILRPFFKKKLKSSRSLDQYSLKFFTVCFYFLPNWGLSKYIETKQQTACFYLILSFLKIKKKSGTSLFSSLVSSLV